MVVASYLYWTEVIGRLHTEKFFLNRFDPNRIWIIIWEWKIFVQSGKLQSGKFFFVLAWMSQHPLFIAYFIAFFFFFYCTKGATNLDLCKQPGCSAVWKKTQRSAFWEICVFRHRGGPNLGSPWNPPYITALSYYGAPIMPGDTSFSDNECFCFDKFYFPVWRV